MLNVYSKSRSDDYVKKNFVCINYCSCSGRHGFAGENNDLRSLFLKNKANICGINLRTFNAKDINGNEIIDEGEAGGNFLNAIERLDEIQNLGINVLHVLPITPVGRLKALGTAGSVYAAEDFWSINPQLVDKIPIFLILSRQKNLLMSAIKETYA